MGSLEVLEARHLKSVSLPGWCLMEKGKEFLFRPSLWCHPWTCLVCTLIIPDCLHLHSGLLCGQALSSFSILDLGPTLNPGWPHPETLGFRTLGKILFLSEVMFTNMGFEMCISRLEENATQPTMKTKHDKCCKDGTSVGYNWDSDSSWSPRQRYGRALLGVVLEDKELRESPFMLGLEVQERENYNLGIWMFMESWDVLPISCSPLPSVDINRKNLCMLTDTSNTAASIP